MGRHAAAEGAGAHPLVAAALAGRAADLHGTHRRGNPGPIGWPGEPRESDGGLGWPVGLPAGGSGTGEPESEADDEADAPAPGGSTTDVVPRGWRRLFTRRPAA